MIKETTTEHVFACSTCGGAARYVNSVANFRPKRPRCERCKRAASIAQSRAASRAKSLALHTLKPRGFSIKHAERAFASATPLPTCYTYKGVQRRIRLTPTTTLAYVVYKWHHAGKWMSMFLHDGNTEGTIVAIVRELRRRGNVSSRMMAVMNALDPPPCACGRPGLYVVGVTTYCKACLPAAITRRKRTVILLDRRATQVETITRTIEHARLASAKHRAMLKPRHRRG